MKNKKPTKKTKSKRGYMCGVAWGCELGETNVSIEALPEDVHKEMIIVGVARSLRAALKNVSKRVELNDIEQKALYGSSFLDVVRLKPEYITDECGIAEVDVRLKRWVKRPMKVK